MVEVTRCFVNEFLLKKEENVFVKNEEEDYDDADNESTVSDETQL